MSTLVLRNRVTGIRLRAEKDNKLPFDSPKSWRRGMVPLGLNKTSALISVHVAGACLGIEQGNKLPFDNIDPQDCRESSTRTEQGIGLLTISVHVAGGQFGQAKFAGSCVRDSHRQSHGCWLKERSLTTVFSLRTQATTTAYATQFGIAVEQHSWHAFRASAYHEAEPQILLQWLNYSKAA